ELMKQADMAMYRAKAAGRNAYRFFEPEMDASMKARRRIETEIAQRHRAGRAGAALPAHCRSCGECRGGNRGTRALAPSGTRSALSRRVHSDCRGERADCPAG